MISARGVTRMAVGAAMVLLAAGPDDIHARGRHDRPGAERAARWCVWIVALGCAWCFATPSAYALNWQYEMIAPDGANPTMALDTTGHLHVAYMPFGSSDFEYAFSNGTQWVREPVFTGSPTSLALDSQGRPHVTYGTYATGVNYAVRTGSGWTTEQVAGPGGRGLGLASLALDTSDDPHVCYYDNNISGTWYAYRTAPGVWPAEPVGPTGVFSGFYGICLALDAGGVPHIAGELMGPNDLGLAAPGASPWSVQQIVDGGEGASLVFDAANRPRIAHHIVNADIVRYTWWDGAAWQTDDVDDSGLAHCWGDENLALDSNGDPHICYFYRSGSGGNGDVNYARWTGQQWETQTIAADASAGGYHYSIVVDGNDVVHIAYGDLDTHALMHAWAVIPEPATLALLAAGLGAVWMRKRRGTKGQRD